MRRIVIKGLNLITFTSPRFKKILSPLILLNFRRKFTKCVIKCAMFIISRNPIQSFSISPSGPYWYKNYAWTVSWSPKLGLNAKRFFKCIKNTRSKYLQEKSLPQFFHLGFLTTLPKNNADWSNRSPKLGFSLRLCLNACTTGLSLNY